MKKIITVLAAFTVYAMAFGAVAGLEAKAQTQDDQVVLGEWQMPEQIYLVCQTPKGDYKIEVLYFNDTIQFSERKEKYILAGLYYHKKLTTVEFNAQYDQICGVYQDEKTAMIYMENAENGWFPVKNDK